MFCKYCGNTVADNTKFCPSCGANLMENASAGSNTNNSSNNTSSNSEQCSNGTAIIGYITWIGFFIALIMNNGNKRNEFVQFHLNQALVLNLFALLAPIPVIGWLIGIVVFIFWIMGIVYAASGEKKAVPLFGGIHLI